MMKKLTILWILAGMLLSMASCSGTAEETGSNSTETSPTVAETIPAETEPENMYPDLPEKTFDGASFRIHSFTAYEYTYVDAEELTGEPVNDAVYNRNTKIEEQYDVAIESTIYLEDPTSVGNAVKTAVTAADDSIDLALNNCQQSMSLTLGGYLTELTQVPYVDLSMPWWDAGAVKDLSVAGRNYFAANSLCLHADNLTSIVFFNKDILANHALEDPYTLVHEGKWTYPKLYEMAQVASEDLNGDGVMDAEDRFGILTAAALFADGLANGGEFLFVKDENDIPQLSIGSDASVTMAEFLYNMMADTNNVLVCNRYSGQFANAWYDLLYPAFQQDQGLFCMGYISYVLYFRDSEVNYGLLPRPKFSENQENYYSQVNYAWADQVTIPSAVRDMECIGVILEALAAESLYTVVPANYEVSIVRKQLRDEDSYEMLEIAATSRRYDFGLFADGLTSIGSNLNNMAQAMSSFTFASTISSSQESVEKAVEKLEKQITELP